MFSKLLLLVALGVVLQQHAAEAAEKKKVVCYQGTWATYRPGNGKFDVEDVDPSLCTHLHYAFFGLQPNGSVRFTDPWLDLEDNGGRGNIKKFNNIKLQNPQLKTMASLGGWNEGSEKFSLVASDPARRKTFVREVVELLIKFGFDGLDLNWEYPNKRHSLKNDDKTNFVTLLKELQEVFAPHNFILSAAVAAVEDAVKISYDVREMAKYLHYISIMAYDLHGAWDGIADHNAPLSAGTQDKTPAQKQLNVEAIVKFWRSQGIPTEKVILGLPLYGHTFTLANPDNHAVGAPTTGPGISGQYSGEAGSIGYNELCERMRTEQWNVVWDEKQKVPYAYKDKTLVSYDDVKSITLKTKYAMAKKLGGVMVWSMEFDDFRGQCGTRYPLLKAINSALKLSIKDNIMDKVHKTVDKVKSFFMGLFGKRKN